MHGSFHICDKCNSKFSYVASSDWYYDIAGQHLKISVRPVWCYLCDSLKSAENLPSIEDCEREIADLTLKRSALGTRHAYPKTIEYAQMQLDWRIHRKSPSRCIWCGGTDLQFLDTEPKTGLLPFVHPNCSGTISFSSSFLGSASPTLFTPEGIRHDAKT